MDAAIFAILAAAAARCALCVGARIRFAANAQDFPLHLSTVSQQCFDFCEQIE
jgi:hypothetical protein